MNTTPVQSRDSTETVKESTERLRDETVETARNLRDQAAEEATRRGEAGKAGVADEISEMGNALRRAAAELREGSPQERTFGHMAGALADLSDRIREKDLGEIAGDMSDFARRNPLAFLGGAALLGFAGTRFARASRHERHKSVDLRRAWDSDEHDDELDAAIAGRPAPAAGTPASPAPATPSSKGVTS